jgi:EmrB/QacA subfamily drug resistance transporter
MSSTADAISSPPSPANGTAVTLLVAGTLFMENLDATVITPALPDMARSFATAPVDLNIGISAYMLTLGVLIPASGWIADRFGARRVFAGAIALFTIASVLCGLAADLPQFLLARILQGVGGALMVPVGRLTVLRTTPKERLVSAIATLTWPALVAPVLGPPLGGWIAQHADWRWIFWLNLPLGLVALLVTFKLVPEGRGDHPGRFDWPGFALSGGGLFAIMLAVEEIGRPVVDWPITLAAALAGTALLALALRHLRRATAPMFSLDVLGLPTFAVTIWGGSLFRMGVSAVPFLLPLMLQLGLGWDATTAGLMLMAVFAGNLVMKPMTTAVMRRFGFRRVLVGNGLLNVVTIGACALVGPATPIPAIAAILFLGGMTRSMQFTAFNSIAFADVPDEEMNAANTLFSTAFQLAMGLGVALGAIAWRIGERLVDNPAEAPFRVAFLIVAAVALLGIVDSVRLATGAGESVLAAKRRKPA